jgi:general nucleoside transport system permease protein
VLVLTVGAGCGSGGGSSSSGGGTPRPATPGRGFIALAAVIFGAWRPYGALGACLLVGFSSGLAQWLQSEADISSNLVATLPYVLTLVALVGVIGRTCPPALVGRPYARN